MTKSHSESGSSWSGRTHSRLRRCLLATAVGTALAGVAVDASRSEEFCLGSYELRDSVAYAVPGELWTFDLGAPDPLEGWWPMHPWGPDDYEVVRRRELADFADDGLPPGAPIIEGNGMIWAGVHTDEADSLCYPCGLGYGPRWAQMLQSPWIPCTGGTVQLEFDYFMDCEETTDLIVRVFSSNGGSFTFIGPNEDEHSWDAPAHKSLNENVGDADSIQVWIAILSGYDNDLDCGHDSEFGAFGVDNIELTGASTASFDFDDGDQGWTNAIFDQSPEFSIHTQDVASYGVGWESWPDCGVQGNVLAFHDAPDGFRYNFWEAAVSPIVDVAELGLASLDGAELSYDILLDYPWEEGNPGLFWRVSVRTYPELCAQTGALKWTEWDRVFSESVYPSEECTRTTADLLSALGGVPELIQVRVEVQQCECCIIQCEGETNPSPVLDNLEVCIEGTPVSEVDDPAEEVLGWQYRLVGNPVDAASLLEFSSEAAAPFEVSLFDVAGRRVAQLERGTLTQGRSTYPLGAWIRTARESGDLIAGTYFLRIVVGEQSRSTRVVIR